MKPSQAHENYKAKCKSCIIKGNKEIVMPEKISGVQLRNGKLLGGGGGVYFSLEQTETYSVDQVFLRGQLASPRLGLQVTVSEIPRVI